MAKLRNMETVYLEMFSHFQEVAKIGVYIIVSIPHCPIDKAQAI